MKELSLHVLDVAQNSVSAGAGRIQIHIAVDIDDVMEITVQDNGRGMSEQMLRSVTDPFTTTRTTRRVGLGLPLFQQAAQQTGGDFHIESIPGEGTTVRARFHTRHIDAPPEGDMTGTIITLIQGGPAIDFIYRRSTPAGEFIFDTALIREQLGGIALNEPEILLWIRQYIEENTRPLG